MSRCAAGSPIPAARWTSRSSRSCAGKARPTSSRRRCASSTARCMPRPSPRAAPGGFRDAELAALRRLLAPFTRMVEIYGNMQKARNILDAYLGPSAGEKVLAGQIKRGDGRGHRRGDLVLRPARLDAARRFDEPARVPRAAERVLRVRAGAGARAPGRGAALHRRRRARHLPGGRQRPAEACAKALAAAQEAHARLDKLNKNRTPPLRFGIGLHLGELTYGNIGTPSRIEFTVVGAAANEAARIESLCKRLDVDLLVSERGGAGAAGRLALARRPHASRRRR